MNPIVLVAALCLAAQSAWAGWVAEYASGDVTYLSSGNRKDVSKDDGTWTIVEGKTGTLTMVNPDSKAYWQGTVDEFCAVMKQIIPQMGSAPANPAIGIEPAGEATIAGFATKKYVMTADGQRLKEVWVAENRELAEENNALKQFGESLGKCTGMPGMQEALSRDPAYRQLEARGWVMKEITYMSGMQINSAVVVSLQQTDVPDSEFEVPAGFSRAGSLMELW